MADRLMIVAMAVGWLPGMAIRHAHGGNTLVTRGGIAPALAKKGLHRRLIG